MNSVCSVGWWSRLFFCLEYNLELTDDGETKITVTDIAGNTVEKNYKLKSWFDKNTFFSIIISVHYNWFE